jgi:hypothetical protein
MVSSRRHGEHGRTGSPVILGRCKVREAALDFWRLWPFCSGRRAIALRDPRSLTLNVNGPHPRR